MAHSRISGFAAGRNAMVQRVVVDATGRNDSGQCHRLASEGDADGVLFVGGLHGPSGPPAVIRRVVTGRVSAVNRQAVRAWSHVSEERGEVVAPSVTNCDALRAVVLVASGGLGAATRLDAAPDTVFTRIALWQSAIALVSGRAHRALVAAATARITAQQVFAVLGCLVAAIAPAAPMRTRRWVVGALERNQLAEALSGQVSRLCPHNTIITDCAAALCL